MHILRATLLLLFLATSQSTLANALDKYLFYINKAESSIIEGNYGQAERFYDSSMQVWQKPFATDLLNALKVANLNGDHNQVRLYAEKLLTLGCTLSFFEYPEYLKDFRATSHWKALIDIYPSIRKKYLKDNDWNTRTIIEYLQAKDQHLRQMDPEYSYLADSIYKADDTIKTTILQLLKIKFPNEYDYGVFLADDTTLVSYDPLHVILLHNYVKLESAPKTAAAIQSFEITDALLDAVHKGDLHPEAFALLNDRSGEYVIGEGYGQMGLVLKLNGKFYYNNESDQIKQSIEQNRMKIGLESRDLARKKLIYGYKNNIHGFILKHSLFGITIFPAGILSEEKINKAFVYSGVTAE